MKKVLVIQTAFLGDVILATAFIEKIHASFPAAEISMLVREGNESLLSGHPFLKEIFVWKKKENKIANLFKLIVIIRKQQFDHVFNLQRFFSSGLITILSGASYKAGYKKNPWSILFDNSADHTIGDNQHEIERNATLLKKFCDAKKYLPKLYPRESDYLKTEVYKTDGYVTMAPASVWFTKQLPENKWVEMVKSAPQGMMIYLLGAPADSELCNRIIASSGNKNAINLAGKLNLLQSAALIKDAQMNYVNDSGPLHIASAMNAPVTAFFCSTVPAFGFGPLSDHSNIVETKIDLSCKPCGLHGFKKCPLLHFKCGTTIEVPVPGSDEN